MVPAYTMAPHSEKLQLMRVVVREDFSRARCDTLIADMKLALDSLKSMDGKTVAHHTKHVKKHHTSSGKSKASNEHYKGEKHSLQGQTGKTHAVC